MDAQDILENRLAEWAGADRVRSAVRRAVTALAAGGQAMAQLLADGPGAHAQVVGANAGGDAQVALDVAAHRLFLERLGEAGVALCASEESDRAVLLDPTGAIAVALDPLDGSSNVANNVSVGTIFSILPMAEHRDPFLQAGHAQLAAGYLIYGPHTDLVLTLRDGTDLYTLDRTQGVFRLRASKVGIPEETSEFAINASNFRHWHGGIRHYIDHCLEGADGPREKDFNMRWIASLVAEASRILSRGGVFLYPRDTRFGYGKGRLRLLYEANPIALLVTQAGGRASTGFGDILDVVPSDLHERTPLIFGAAREVTRIERYKANPEAPGIYSPLFNKRGLFRVQ